MAQKRTLESFFTTQPPSKQRRLSPPTSTSSSTRVAVADAITQSNKPSSTHPTFPFPVAQLPPEVESGLDFTPASEPKSISNQPDLDLLYFEPYIPAHIERELFHFLRRELFYYRVKYTIKRGPTTTAISTPRYTTVFGVDGTTTFTESGTLIDAQSRTLLPQGTYTCKPRPLPACLDRLRSLAEAATSCTFNFCLVNYYASGADSISYHSDDERFLGREPAIASLSLGARRDFLMKHKAAASGGSALDKSAGGAELGAAATPPLKLNLASGDMVLMRGRTQACWLHSIPKRSGRNAGGGRINITFRKALVKGGTENYYRYNVGDGPVFKWDDAEGAMVEWKGS